jgi:hypothetical protein
MQIANSRIDLRAQAASVDDCQAKHRWDGPTEDALIQRGREAFERLASGRTWDDWVAVGEALLVGRAAAMREARTNTPAGRRYNEVFGSWLAHYGFDRLDKSDRAKLMEVMSRRADWWATATSTASALGSWRKACFGLSFQTLADYGWVANAVKPSFRNEVLTFAHHRQVARMEPDEQHYWLARAAEGEWSWRSRLPSNKRVQLNHPTTVLRTWTAATQLPKSMFGPKASSPMAKVKASLAETIEENHRLQQEIKRGGGDLWGANDRADDIARVMMEKLTRHKAEQVARAILKRLKTTS